VNRPEVGRAFVAVRPPEAVLDAVEERVGEPLASSQLVLRRERRSQWHFTLVFLGAVAQLEPVKDAVREVAAAHAPFSLRLGGAGAFPNDRRARVVWLGVTEGGLRLEALNAGLSTALGPLGYPPEERPYHPHLTVARVKVPASAGPLLEAIGPAPVGPAWTVDEFVLYESRTAPSGATYSVLDRFPLSFRAAGPE
jgi:2'-5' RNA ligase